MMSLLFLLLGANLGDSFKDFPSLITTNATMAVVIDKGFFFVKEDYRSTMKIIFDMVTETMKKESHFGGIVIHVFRDANVNLRRDYTVLMTIATCHETWRFYEIARKFELVHLAITDQDCPRIPHSEGITIPLIEPGEELSQIFLDLRMMNVLSWNNVNVLHDDTFGRDTIARVTKAISDRLPYKKLTSSSRSMFTLKHGESEQARRQHITEILSNFRTEKLGTYFLVIATANMVVDVMEIAKTLNMVHPNSQWLYVITDSSVENATNITSFTDMLAEGGNVAFMYNATNTDICYNGLLCHIKELVKALTDAVGHSLKSEVDLFNRVTIEEFQIIRISKYERRKEILKHMNTKLFQSASSVDEKCGRCLLWRISSAITWGNYFVHGKSVAHLIDSGSWMPESGVNLTDVMFPHVVHGFRAINLPIATYHNPPWQTITVSPSGEKMYSGLIFDVIKYLGKKLNFTYTILTPEEDGKIKSTYYNVSSEVLEFKTMLKPTKEIPKEIIELVRSKKVLIAACAYTVNDYGKHSINFTLPVFVQTYSFLTSKPRQLSRALLFTSPFTKETWACLAASIIVMGPILYLVHKYSPFSTKMSGLNSSWQCVWYVYGALLQQGGMYLPHSDSARLLVGVWWLIVMVLVATYSGSLVAFLTFPKMDASILTIEDLLARKDRLTWGFPNGSFLEEYLQNTNEEKYRVLLSRSERHNVSDEEDVVKRVKEGKHVLIDWRSSLRFLMRKDLLLSGGCHFSLGTDEFMDEPIAMIIAQGSPYLHIINAELQRMHESGLMNKWISEKMPIKDKCWESETNSQAVNKRKVNVADMQGIFFVLFIGVFLATCFLCGELYWHRRKVAKERRLIRPFVS